MRPPLRAASRKTPARRFCGSLLLAFILVFAQQGEWKHELGHLVEPPAASQKQAPVQPEHCPLCLAFAHLASAAKTEVFAPQLLAGLAFHYAPPPRVANAQTAALPPRNRGPPSS